MAEFLKVGGTPDWLQGLHCAPQKLRNLNEINKILAHRPWLITKEHIEVSARGGGLWCVPSNKQPGGGLLFTAGPQKRGKRGKGSLVSRLYLGCAVLK